MGGRWSGADILSPQQRQAARLELTGASGPEIAEQVGVTAVTVSRWRARADYQRAVSELHNQVDAELLRDVRRVRGNALKVVAAGLARSAQAMASGSLPPRDVASLTRAALDTFRATAAQTGLPETTRHEMVDLAHVIDYLDRLTDAELDAVEGAVSEE